MNNKNKKEKLEQVWLQQKEIMKKITGNENEKMDILDDYLNEKYTDEDIKINNKKETKEKLEQVWLQQKEIMKKITGNENEKMDILDDYLNEKYTDEDGE